MVMKGVTRSYVGWIPGLGILGLAKTFLRERFFNLKNRNWFSELCQFWGYENFGSILWKTDFKNFAQLLKLRGRHLYTWLFHSLKITEDVNLITVAIFVYKMRGTYLILAQPTQFQPP